jgi:hypothetical protein
MLFKKFNLFLAIILASSLFSFAQTTEKLIAKKWKMVQTLINNENVKPKHKNLVITFNKDKSFTISASKEQTHKGTWSLIEDGKKVVLNDQTNNEEKTYTVESSDKKHLSLGGYDGNTTIALIRYKKGHYNLSHTEALIAKEWHIYKTDKEENMDMEIAFKKNKQFEFIPYGSKMPVASGRWRLSKDEKVIILEMIAENEELHLDIMDVHRHELILKSEETGVINYLHDRKLYSKDVKKKEAEMEIPEDK